MLTAQAPFGSSSSAPAEEAAREQANEVSHMGTVAGAEGCLRDSETLLGRTLSQRIQLRVEMCFGGMFALFAMFAMFALTLLCLL